jgi:putative Holliday junction resolvase
MTNTSSPIKNNHANTVQTVLAFDYGEKRIGVAVGNTITRTAEPLKIIQQQFQYERFKAIEQVITDWQPQVLVVGLPRHPDGAEHAMTQKAKRFGNQLQGRFQKEVVWVDERYTSVSVEGGDDALAAQLILQQYLQELGGKE